MVRATHTMIISGNTSRSLHPNKKKYQLKTSKLNKENVVHIIIVFKK